MIAIRLKPSWNLRFMGLPSPEKFADEKNTRKALAHKGFGDFRAAAYHISTSIGCNRSGDGGAVLLEHDGIEDFDFGDDVCGYFFSDNVIVFD